MLSKKKVEKDYERYKKIAMKLFALGNYEKALYCIELACKTAYCINFRFSDYEFENLISKISREIISRELFKPKQGRYVFYDYFAMDNRGLTQQYIRALISWQVEFLYIISGQCDLENSKKILQELNSYPKATIYKVPSGLTRIDSIRKIADEVSLYMPEKTFIHTTPWDTIGITCWNAFPEVTRYKINITDHAYWIGINCADYFIEYRNYGYNLSMQYRDIDPEKLLIQPYYAILTSGAFKGLPKIDNSIYDVKLFSGGQLYKIYGENGIYMNMMKHIFDKYPNTVLYFAGDGNIKPLQKFIKDNSLENRWILIGNRKDIIPVIQEMDIFIGTYPISGGLMSYVAAACNKPVVTYTDPLLLCNEIEGVFGTLPANIKMTFMDIDSYYNEIGKLINNKDYRIQKANELFEILLSPEYFNNNLKELLNKNINIIEMNNIVIDTNKFCNLYLEMENNFIHSYSRILLNKIIFFRNPIRFFVNLIISYIYYDKSKLLKVISKKLNYRRRIRSAN